MRLPDNLFFRVARDLNENVVGIGKMPLEIGLADDEVLAVKKNPRPVGVTVFVLFGFNLLLGTDTRKQMRAAISSCFGSPGPMPGAVVTLDFAEPANRHPLRADLTR